MGSDGLSGWPQVWFTLLPCLPKMPFSTPKEELPRADDPDVMWDFEAQHTLTAHPHSTPSQHTLCLRA